MIVKSIELKNFRNYRELKLEFNENTNIFYGDNAQGKTNILEAVYLSGTTKSHKGSRDRDMIFFGEEEGHLRTLVKKGEMDYRIDIHLKKNRTKGIAVNGVPIKKAGELFGIANFVFFSPEDLSIIKQGPGERRRFLDMELCQLDRVYLYNLANYNRVVAQRNKLLKDLAYRSDLEETLDIWDMQLAEYGKKIIEGRELFIRRLGEIISGIHKNLSGGREELQISYEKNAEPHTAAPHTADRNDHRKLSVTGCPEPVGQTKRAYPHQRFYDRHCGDHLKTHPGRIGLHAADPCHRLCDCENQITGYQYAYPCDTHQFYDIIFCFFFFICTNTLTNYRHKSNPYAIAENTVHILKNICHSLC